MKVLVTGGAGYIGSHTCKALAAAGHTPVVFDNLSTGHRWAVKWGPLVVGDIQDGRAVEAAIDTHGIEAVVHFAASAYVGESMTDPGKYFRNNSIGSLSLIEAMIRRGVDKLVFSSTCATYGNPLQLPIDESSPTVPVNPYGESKLFVERALRWFRQADKMQSIALRYFNAAGADPEGEIGEVHRPETHLIPLAFRAALDPDYSLHVFGSDYPTPDGTAVRDYVHVCDLADAHLRALEALREGRGSPFYNLGSGAGSSVREVIRGTEEVTGRPVRHTMSPRRAGDPPSLVASCERAGAELGWTPARSQLGVILADAWRWEERWPGMGLD